ncbi:hypothetical protein ACVNS2_32295 [Paenibacillus caseinilyticus]|uniref:Uncharacterized protein n=1 Tax=Paenibacillus mucilaginosus K02 TaxID=997761 RepID=I0BSQ3_9BACL|nr:hypothetical protein [Paenibacillus mucilaginosus]AFH65400.1 hypothetical protein B2K_32645 [Paenibacillus mucilaginosus K02]
MLSVRLSKHRYPPLVGLALGLILLLLSSCQVPGSPAPSVKDTPPSGEFSIEPFDLFQGNDAKFKGLVDGYAAGVRIRSTASGKLLLAEVELWEDGENKGVQSVFNFQLSPPDTPPKTGEFLYTIQQLSLEKESAWKIKTSYAVPGSSGSSSISATLPFTAENTDHIWSPISPPLTVQESEGAYIFALVGGTDISFDPLQSAQKAPWAYLLKLSVVSSDELPHRRPQ